MPTSKLDFLHFVMKKVAVFGKPGGGKSTLSQNLSNATGIPLYQLDKIEYLRGGEKVSEDVYLQKHNEILQSDRWIIDGLGTIATFRERLSAADTLIYINLPLRVHYWWVTKRLFTSPFSQPVGWPERSPMIKSTLLSWANLRKSAKLWTPEFSQKLAEIADHKTVYQISSTKQLNSFINQSIVC